jgi:hypothetical protein
LFHHRSYKNECKPICTEERIIAELGYIERKFKKCREITANPGWLAGCGKYAGDILACMKDIIPDNLLKCCEEKDIGVTQIPAAGHLVFLLVL